MPISMRRGCGCLSGPSTHTTRVCPGTTAAVVGANVPLPADQPGTSITQRFGPGFTATVMMGGELIEDLVLTGILRCTFESNLTVGNEAIADTWILDPGAGLALSWRPNPHVTMQAGIDSNLFLDGLGHNTPARVTATLGMRYGVF